MHCTYCQTDTHDDINCWSTRTVDWQASKLFSAQFVPLDLSKIKLKPVNPAIQTAIDEMLDRKKSWS
jgi:hypothetical protein